MTRTDVQLREKVGGCVYEALLQVCGGSVQGEKERKHLYGDSFASISFPNKNISSAGGKPQNIEIRIALSLFHRWRRTSPGSAVTITSDLGLHREIKSPRDFAKVVCVPLEEACRKQNVAHNVQFQPSGVICIVTNERAQVLRQAGKLPCPYCVQWCKGEKGLWWHQQQNHRIEHAEAAALASASTNQLALIPYNAPSTRPISERSLPDLLPKQESSEDPLEYIKQGDLEAVRKAVQNGYTPSTELDHRGASPLMWAAGFGHLDIVRYLIEESRCRPNQPQQGKRSFSGRTALHWAARNGHLSVVTYLVCECKVNLEAATIDGTTAFCWACWQGHLPIMKFLDDQGCDIHTMNSFGCNPVLWCAQGKGDVSTMKWLQGKKCDLTLINNNRHGVLHKAAQRGQQDICAWFFENLVSQCASESALKLVGPDTEGYCPSDLAGIEGNEKLARFLAKNEMTLVQDLKLNQEKNRNNLPVNWPDWLHKSRNGISMRLSEKEQHTWERYGGIRRMMFSLTSVSKKG